MMVCIGRNHLDVGAYSVSGVSMAPVGWLDVFHLQHVPIS